MFAPLAVLFGLACSAPPLEIGLEVQRGNSSRGTSGLESAALADARARAQSEGRRLTSTDTKAGVSELVALATVAWDHELSHRWVATGMVGAGWVQADGNAEVTSSSGTTGFHWTIASPMLEVGAAVRRKFGEHWAVGSELSVSRGILGSGTLESISSDEKLDEGSVGESGTFLEDVHLAWRVRCKIGPQARYGRFVAFPWVGVGSTPVMDSDSRIAGLDADEEAEWTKLGFGLRLGWHL